MSKLEEQALKLYPVRTRDNKKGTGTFDANYPRRQAYLRGYNEAIDKAVKWLYGHREDVQTEDNGISGWIPDELIMDFKQDMEQ
jgi:hypothetical protein